MSLISSLVTIDGKMCHMTVQPRHHQWKHFLCLSPLSPGGTEEKCCGRASPSDTSCWKSKRWVGHSPLSSLLLHSSEGNWNVLAACQPQEMQEDVKAVRKIQLNDYIKRHYMYTNKYRYFIWLQLLISSPRKRALSGEWRLVKNQAPKHCFLTYMISRKQALLPDTSLPALPAGLLCNKNYTSLFLYPQGLAYIVSSIIIC